jgi:hydroxymethylpyrimidine/phosphomethylpyrimidine kinase
MARSGARLRLLTIAGSDSSGGAGIQGDLKTFAAFGAYGMSAVTAVTAQSTRGIASLKVLPAALVGAQIDAVATDIGVDGAKTGMLGSAAIVRAVARAVMRHRLAPLVIDPILISTSGQRLLAPAALGSLCRDLFPLGALITPNLHEAEVLTGKRVRTLTAMADAARRLHQATGVPVLVTGGHAPGAPVDLLADSSGLTRFVGRRVPRRAIHGAGCALSAAITARLAAGRPLVEAIAEAKGFLEGALAAAPAVGAGASPPDPFWRGLPAARSWLGRPPASSGRPGRSRK